MKILKLGEDGVLPIMDFKGKYIVLMIDEYPYRLVEYNNGYAFKEPIPFPSTTPSHYHYYQHKTIQECCQDRLEGIWGTWMSRNPIIMFDNELEFKEYYQFKYKKYFITFLVLFLLFPFVFQN